MDTKLVSNLKKPPVKHVLADARFASCCPLFSFPSSPPGQIPTGTSQDGGDNRSLFWEQAIQPRGAKLSEIPTFNNNVVSRKELKSKRTCDLVSELATRFDFGALGSLSLLLLFALPSLTLPLMAEGGFSSMQKLSGEMLGLGSG